MPWCTVGKKWDGRILDETKDSREEDVKEIILTRLRQRECILLMAFFAPLEVLVSSTIPFQSLLHRAKTDWINEWFNLEKYIDEITAKIYSRMISFRKSLMINSWLFHQRLSQCYNVGDELHKTTSYRTIRKRGQGSDLFYILSHWQAASTTRHSTGYTMSARLIMTLSSLHISFDQNSVPYNSAGIAQIVRNGDIWEWRFTWRNSFSESP